MTENKRFYISSDNNQNIYDTVLKCYYSSIDAQRLCSVLNELNNQVDAVRTELQLCEEENTELQKENEQLKSDNNRLVNETAKIIGEHQRKVFDLIDKKIDELEKRYKFGQEVYKGCPMHNIRFGINTLKELKKELQND